MKTAIIAIILLFSIFSFEKADAQIQVSVNIGNQPDWGPVGYDRVDYYYLPEIETYYDVNSRQYVYFENNRWVRRGSLPGRYRNYNKYRGYKVVINERAPWERNNEYRTRYNGYGNRRDQIITRDSKDEKYAKHWNKKREKEDRKERKDDFKKWKKNGKNDD